MFVVSCFTAASMKYGRRTVNSCEADDAECACQIHSSETPVHYNVLGTGFQFCVSLSLQFLFPSLLSFLNVKRNPRLFYAQVL